MIASLSFLYANNVADRIAGAVFLDSGSIKIGPGSIPRDNNCSVIKKRKFEFVTVI